MLSQARERFRRTARLLWCEPGFAAHAILILALGIGATAAVFSLIQGALLEPPPYADADRLVLIGTRGAENRSAFLEDTWPAVQWEEWQDSAESLDGVAAYSWTFNFLVLEDGSESEEGMLVSPEYFGVLGLEPILGRAFDDSDALQTSSPGIILGYDLWQRQFDGDANILGREVRLSRMPPRTVIGVMPEGVRFLPVPGAAREPNYDINAKVDFWLPIVHDLPETQRNQPRWNVVARLSDGATPSDAQTELGVITARQAETTAAFEGVTARIEPVTSVLNAAGERILFPLLAAAALVLLISCSNAAALLLVRGLQRQHEYGVRSALGADRARLFTHVIGESLWLALLGGAVGVLLALGAIALFKSLAGSAVPRLDAVSMGWPIIAFGLASSLVACVLAGLFPAWLASKLDPIQALRETAKSTASPAQRRVLGGVLVLQMALTMALLVGAGLLARTMYNLSAVQSGFDARNVVAMTVTAVDGNWQDFHERALERVAEIPGVDNVAFAWGVPLTGNSWPVEFEVEGYVPPNGSDDPRISIGVRAVTAGYFALLGQTIEEGRDFRSTDRLPPPDPANPTAPPDLSKTELVAVVNRAFVDRYFGGANAIGKELRIQAGPNRIANTIVGVVNDTRVDDLARAPEPQVYTSLLQNTAFSKHLVVRTSVPPSSIVGLVQRELKAILPTVAIENAETLEDIRAESLGSRAFAMQLLAGFATVAIVLTLAGVYSVLSLSVAARRRELAIRTAVGADARKIMTLVLGNGLALIGAGLVAGVVVSFALSRVLQAMLFEVGPADPLTLGVAALAFALVALLACCLPAARAARVDPAEALKGE